MIGDTWQWIPFIFIVCWPRSRASRATQVEAAELDGARRWQIFRDITWPSIAPVAATVVLIRRHRGVQDRRPAQRPDQWRPGHRHRIDDAAFLHRMAHAQPRRLGGGRLLLLFVSTIVCVSFFNFVVEPRTAESTPMSLVRSQDSSARWRRPPASSSRPAWPVDAGRAVSALLGGDHFVQAADRRFQRAGLPAVHRLPAVAPRLALHLRRRCARHVPAVSQLADHRHRSTALCDADRFDGRLCADAHRSTGRGCRLDRRLRRRHGRGRLCGRALRRRLADRAGGRARALRLAAAARFARRPRRVSPIATSCSGSSRSASCRRWSLRSRSM